MVLAVNVIVLIREIFDYLKDKSDRLEVYKGGRAYQLSLEFSLRSLHILQLTGLNGHTLHIMAIGSVFIALTFKLQRFF